MATQIPCKCLHGIFLFLKRIVVRKKVIKKFKKDVVEM